VSRAFSSAVFFSNQRGEKAESLPAPASACPLLLVSSYFLASLQVPPFLLLAAHLNRLPIQRPSVQAVPYSFRKRYLQLFYLMISETNAQSFNCQKSVRYGAKRTI
jgi:hypothetical protein